MSASSAPTLVVTAMPEELEPLLDRARGARRRGRNLFRARIGAVEVVLAATGEGASRASAAVGRLCDAIAPASLVGLGVAGALSFDLAPSELLAAQSVRDALGEAPSPDARLLARAMAHGARGGALLAIERPIVTADEKRALASTLDGAAPAAVDMESAAWARAAAARGVPYLIVRAISDSADEELPSYLADSMGEHGGIRRSAVIGHALTRPSTIPALWRMRNRVRSCGEKLAVFLERLLDERVD